jgi:hypothetical protein
MAQNGHLYVGLTPWMGEESGGGEQTKHLPPVRILKEYRSLKQGDALSPLLLNFASEFAIRDVQENQMELNFCGTRQLLVCADDVSFLGDKHKKGKHRS